MRMEDEHLGLRLEDMILITDTGYDNLSQFVPIDIEGIEKMMREPGLSDAMARRTRRAIHEEPMNRQCLAILAALFVSAPAPIIHAAQDVKAPELTPIAITSDGSVHTASGVVDYQAVLGTLVVHPKGWDDAAARDDKDNPAAVATMSYVAYFKKGADAAKRPLTFVFNGGPGSSTIWLHMGAFGPRRVVTADHSHTPAAPYRSSTTITACSTRAISCSSMRRAPGCRRITGKDKEKAFFGVDQDVHAFADVHQRVPVEVRPLELAEVPLRRELRHDCARAVLAQRAADEDDIDFNGVMLLSQILDCDLMPDDPEHQSRRSTSHTKLALPTYAATAWYHHKLANPPSDLRAFLDEVEQFAISDYALALIAGQRPSRGAEAGDCGKSCRITPGSRWRIIKKANLRIDGGEFEQSCSSTSRPDDRGGSTRGSRVRRWIR